jgi:hypothetical protein
VRDVARKYFIEDNLTVAVLEPQPMGTEAAMAEGAAEEAHVN